MPALPAAPGVLRVAIGMTIGGSSPGLSRFYIKYTGTAPTAAQLATFDAAVSSALATDLCPLMDSASTFVKIETTDLSSATGAVDVSAISHVGTRSGSGLPSQVAFVTSYEISRRYRGGHPRGYWRFGVEADVASGQAWTSGLVTSVNSDMATFMSAVTGAGWTGAGTLEQVNVSYYSGFHVVTNPITGRARNVPLVRSAPTVDVVSAISARSSIGTQRRREQFVD